MLKKLEKRCKKYVRPIRVNIGKLTQTGGPGSNPGVPQLWRLVTLKPLKLQQCTLHLWKPLIFFYLDKRGQGHSYVLNTQKAFVKIPGFTIVSLLAGYMSIWLSVGADTVFRLV